MGIKLRINEFEIEMQDDEGYFWLREGEYSSLDLKLEQLEDLKEIIKRFENKLNNAQTKDGE